MCMMAFFVIKKRPLEACMIVLIMVISVFYMIISYEDVYDLSKIREEDEDEEHPEKRKRPGPDALKKWK